jgi:hypothetical protein
MRTRRRLRRKAASECRANTEICLEKKNYSPCQALTSKGGVKMSRITHPSSWVVYWRNGASGTVVTVGHCVCLCVCVCVCVRACVYMLQVHECIYTHIHIFSPLTQTRARVSPLLGTHSIHTYTHTHMQHLCIHTIYWGLPRPWCCSPYHPS